MFAILFAIVIQCAQSAYSDFYDIPAYYGHFSRRYFQPQFILAANFARV